MKTSTNDYCKHYAQFKINCDPIPIVMREKNITSSKGFLLCSKSNN